MRTRGECGPSFAEGVPLGTGAVDALCWTLMVASIPLARKSVPALHVHTTAESAHYTHVWPVALWPCVGMCMHGAVARSVAQQRQHVRTCTTHHTQGTFYRQIHLPHATCSHVQSLHRSHSTDDMCTLAQDELCAEKHLFIHASCLTLRCTRHCGLPHLLYLLPLLCHCRPLLRTQTCCPRMQLSTVKTHGRMALLRNTTPPQVMNPKGSSSTGFWSNHKIK